MTTPPLQPGQYWRTRSGSIVYVTSINPEWVSDPLPVLGISKGLHVEYEQNWYRLDGGFFEEGESDDDLITYLPDCTSLDWVPPEHPKYYKTSTEHLGYFRVDSNKSYSWITPDGREVRQDGSPSILTKHPFVEITKEEAETRVKKSDAPETVIEINDSVLSLLNTPTALLINGEVAGLITEVEFGLMNDEIRKKTPVARQYLGVSVSTPEIFQTPVHPPEHPYDWVIQDKVPARTDDEYRWSDWPADEWRKVTPSMERQCVSSGAMSQWKNGVILSVRCRRHALPPDPSPKPPSQNTSPEVWSLIEDANRENFCTYQEQRSSFTPIQLLIRIRICSAQQSMLSELSAQVDALRSEKTNRGGCCGQPD